MNCVPKDAGRTGLASFDIRPAPSTQNGLNSTIHRVRCLDWPHRLFVSLRPFYSGQVPSAMIY
jgi:hypothetical protein